MHADGTARPQTVDAAVPPIWHCLPGCVGARTGHAVLLETSINVRGEPMVCTPDPTIRFLGSGRRRLASGGFLIRTPCG